MTLKHLLILPTKKNINLQYSYLKDKINIDRLSIYYDSIIDLNDGKITIEQLQKLKNKKMIKIKIQEVIIWLKIDIFTTKTANES